MLEGLAGFFAQILSDRAITSLTAYRAKNRTLQRFRGRMTTAACSGDACNILAYTGEDDLGFGDYLAKREIAEIIYETALWPEDIESTVELLLEEACDIFDFSDETTMVAAETAIRESIEICRRIVCDDVDDSEKRAASIVLLNSEKKEDRQVSKIVGALKSEPSARERWENYQRWLGTMSMPAFGTDLTLDQLYIPLNVYVSTDRTVKESDSLISDWAHGKPGYEDRPILLLAGDPGSGKSTVAKINVRNMANDHDLNVAFVRLRYLNISDTTSLSEKVLCYINDTYGEGFDIDRLPTGKTLILVLDGLDEVAARGQTTWGLAMEFLRDTSIELARWREESGGLDIRVLITLRKSLSANIPASRTTNSEGVVMAELLPFCRTFYRSSTSIGYVQNIADHCDLLEHDKRFDWWENYGRLVGESQWLRVEKIIEWDEEKLTAQPILNHLVAINCEGIDFDKEVSRLNIYEQLIIGVVRRQGEDPTAVGSMHKASTFGNIEGFVKFLELAALCAWSSPVRGSITDLGKLERACVRANLTEAFNNFRLSGDCSIRENIIAGYFRPASSDATTGSSVREESYEFVHNSIMEYLVARALSVCIESLLGSECSDDCEADLLSILSKAELTDNIASFLAEMEAGKHENAQQKMLNCLIRALVSSGCYDTVALFDWACKKQELEALQRACANLLIIQSSISIPGSTVLVGDQQVFLNWLLSYARRGESYRQTFDTSLFKYLNNIAFDNVDLTRFRFDHIELRWVTMSKVYMLRGDFSGAGILGMKMSHSRFVASRFPLASITSCRFDDVDLSSSNYERATIKETEFHQCNLASSNFQCSTLLRLKFVDCNLANVDFSGANCDDAVIENCILDGATMGGLKQESTGERRSMIL